MTVQVGTSLEFYNFIQIVDGSNFVRNENFHSVFLCFIQPLYENVRTNARRLLAIATSSQSLPTHHLHNITSHSAITLLCNKTGSLN
jgi:hypothetical protein